MSVRRKIKKSIQKPLPVVIIPDNSYLDDTGHLIPTELIVLTHADYYKKFAACLYDVAKARTDVKKVRIRNVKSK